MHLNIKVCPVFNACVRLFTINLPVRRPITEKYPLYPTWIPESFDIIGNVRDNSETVKYDKKTI